MVNFISPDKTSLGLTAFTLAAHLIYNNLWNRGGSVLKAEQTATRVFNVPMKPQAASTALALGNVLPSAKTVGQSAAGVAVAAGLELGAPALAAASGGSTAAGAAAGEGIFTGAYTAASTAAKAAWSHLPLGTLGTLGAGAAGLGLAYLAYKYLWRGNGVNITNTNTNTNTVHINLVGLDPNTIVTKTEDGEGTTFVTIEQKKDPQLHTDLPIA